MSHFYCCCCCCAKHTHTPMPTSSRCSTNSMSSEWAASENDIGCCGWQNIVGCIYYLWKEDVRGSSRGGYRADAAVLKSLHKQPNSSPSWVQLWVVSLLVWSTPRGYLVDSWVKMRISLWSETPLGPPWTDLSGGLLSQYAFLATLHLSLDDHSSSGHALQAWNTESYTGHQESPLGTTYIGYSGSWGHADLCLWILMNSEWLACGHTFPVQTNQFSPYPLPSLLHVSYSLDHYPPALLTGQTAKDSLCLRPTENYSNYSDYSNPFALPCLQKLHASPSHSHLPPDWPWCFSL